MSTPDLNVVSLPRLLSEQHDGDAGEDAGQHAVEETWIYKDWDQTWIVECWIVFRLTAFAKILRVLIDLAEATASATHALK